MKRLIWPWFLAAAGFIFTAMGIIFGIIGADVLNIPFTRMDLVPIAVSFLGIMLLFAGIMFILDKRFETLKEKDKGSEKIVQKAKSKAFNLMIGLYSIGTITLALLGYLNEVSFFSLIGLYIIGLLFYSYQLVMNRRAA
ncbi:hypothetical protein KZX50_18445 [Bacillus infantis]|uniref:hypothetical protein n=1 Tax=Bacillus infantis TaxID=324767 RepID=UPI0020069F88|nr:hypothetical protein [Bacillus infantis]MCK6207424.1 hypothetical protein [Bacillus infantis]